MKRGSAVLVALTILAAGAMGACGKDAGSGWSGTITDSAGVSIVMSPDEGIWTDADRPALQEVLRIGSASGDSTTQFGLVTSVDIDTRGDVYVLDQQARRVRVFDSTGKFVRAIGGAGSGPGELGMMAAVMYVTQSDTVVVPDLMNARVNRYATDGTPAGSYPLQLTDGIPARWEERRDGSAAVQIRTMVIPGLSTTSSEYDMVIVRNVQGQITDTIMRMPAGATVKLSGGSAQFTIFSPEPVWALASGGGAYYGVNSEYSIHAVDTSGAVHRIVRRKVERRPVTDADKQAITKLMRETFASSGAPPAAIDKLLQGLGFADYFPAIGSLLGGPDNTLWVQRARTVEEMQALGTDFDPQDLGSPRWDVFDGEGKLMGEIQMPDKFTPLRFVNDRLIGIARDENDVQYVTVLRLTGQGRG